MIRSLNMADKAKISALCAVALLASCQRPMNPVVPAGQAGYDAVAIDPSQIQPQSYDLAPGDKIAVRVYGEPELSVDELVIDNAGFVNLPLIGEIRASGQSAGELAQGIQAAYAADFVRDPRVNVVVLQGRVRTIAVEGEVEQPGVFPYAEGQTLLSALALARSPTDVAKLDEVIIFRTVEGQRLAGRFDLQDIRGGRSPDVALVPGDVVVVGYSNVRGAYLDVVKALPVVGFFRPIN
ncbi:polysaccharide export protein [Qipengyuania aquimaris]|uniref:polysaccharide biosynthesis/export family protein n=1 Tax=Qipengyuania aquimaris TaxID=255984 RepID=UPI001C95EF6D|nr:polysaccharide biosynthesis/export family protein [Qipengyuania aquimaris]MBY6129304.1 polysaccharide export protein [Qipengyuania aquimaris]